MSENWVDGTYEAGADADSNEPVEPVGDVAEGEGDGVELGLGQGSTFEPEEDVEAP